MKKQFLFLVLLFSCFVYSQTGNVGINTSSPSATLDIVSKDSTATTKGLKISNSSNTEMLTVLNNGQVGINQASPSQSALLELNSSNSSLLLTRVASVSNIATPSNGMIVYDISQNCVRGYENGAWSGCLSGGGGAQPPTPSFGMCDTSWLTNPLSAGISAARGDLFPQEDRPIILDSSGKKFYVNSRNLFYDLDIQNYYNSFGTPTTQIPYKFPVAYSVNTDGSWREMKVFRQLFPDKTWKQFSTFVDGNDGYSSYWNLLLSTDGKLKAVRYEQRSNNSNGAYIGISGATGISKTYTTVNSNSDPNLFFVNTDIQAYSALGVPTNTNWGWFEPYINNNYNTYSNSNAVLAYNSSDGLFYTWGSMNNQSSQTPITTKALLRTSPTNIAQSMTPLPATILNNLLTTLNKQIKPTTTEACSVIVVDSSSPHIAFVTTDGIVVKYFYNTGNYVSLSLPVGVKPVSIDIFDSSTLGPPSFPTRLFILGTDGKVYQDNTLASAVGQTSIVTTLAHSIWSSTGYPVVSQYARGTFTTQDGKLGLLNTLTNSINFPLPFQTPNNLTRILYPFTNNNGVLLLSNNNLAEYNINNPPYYMIGGYSGTPFNNYIYRATGSTQSDGTRNSNIFYPTKCVTYTSTLNPN